MSNRNDIFDALLTALESLKTDYSMHPNKIVPYTENHQSLFAEDTPILMVLDEGNEQILAEDDESVMLMYGINLKYYISGANWQDVQLEMNNFIESQHAFLESSPSLGAYVLDLRFSEARETGWKHDTKEAWKDIMWEVVYYRDKATQNLEGNDTHGTGFIPTGRGYIKALMDDLITDLVGSTPELNYAYERHNKANLKLNTVTIEFETTEDVDKAANDYRVQYPMAFSLRIHTGYAGGEVRSKTSTALLNSIINKLKNNIKITTDTYRIGGQAGVPAIQNIQMNQSFDESGTTGASLVVVVTVNITHTQE